MISNEAEDVLNALVTVLDEHIRWFGAVTNRLFYHDVKKGAAIAPGLKAPAGFAQWAQKAVETESIDPAVVERLRGLHDDMHRMGDYLVKHAADAAERPDIHAYTAFSSLYERFVTELRGVERDFTMIRSGLDPLTGLRNRKAMVADYLRELERLERRGSLFCLVLARLDGADSLPDVQENPQGRTLVRSIGAYITRCMRSFDDAYYLPSYEFVMILKYSDKTGGTAAIERLRGMLEQDPILRDPENPRSRVTMSYCAGEPVPGDQLEDLLRNMRIDIQRYDEGGNTTLEYHEQSPLQRFLIEQG